MTTGESSAAQPDRPPPIGPHDVYFKDNAIPWMVDHLKMRGIGLQVFIAGHGVLLVGWIGSRHWLIPCLGLLTCVSFHLWDLRIRKMLWELLGLGERLVDQPRFGVDPTEPQAANDGVYKTIRAMRNSPWKKGSHTLAIQIFLAGVGALWLVLFGCSIGRC